MKQEMYTTYAKQYDLAAQDNLYNAHFERPNTLELVGDVAGKKVLDLGCGSGIYAQILLERGATSVTCIDAAQEMIDIVKDKLGDSVNAYAQNLALGLPEETNAQYDLVICPLMVHYIEDLRPLFNDIQRVLKPGGQFVFSTHHPFADFECSASDNYFEKERIEDVWDTIGKPVSVAFYRRSLQDITDAITGSNMAMLAVSEGKVNEKIREISQEHYQRLATYPNFIFIKCVALS
ncbi:MAG: class I SAM-dependent methyltransferase [Pseudomonadota bacterium]|uniref:class I SAM-dependent methyltransferase n=1 Tax=Vibrio campbellii TaxID=680 RepID=UPI0009B8B406|nr:class I SAM-dependent methyltransferase [Vibrio campbellii]ARR09579.1 SAM-dependent methyltransferase [Vibrio campbellii]HDM8215397.1 class I SAM-dependent methyltransferase [Vibrio campbellii]